MTVSSILSFRMATPADIPCIQHIAQHTWPATYDDTIGKQQVACMLEEIYSEAALLHQMTKLNHQFVLGSVAGQFAGFASYQFHYPAAQQMMLHKFYILPLFHGQGHGLAFLKYLEALAVQSAHETLTLKVFHKNVAAIRFYEKNGFEKKGHVISYTGNGFEINDHLMHKPVGAFTS